MQIEDEIQKGIIPNPAETDPITGEPLPQEGGDPAADPAAQGGGDLGDVPVEDDLEQQAQITDAQYQKDTKKAEI